IRAWLRTGSSTRGSSPRRPSGSTRSSRARAGTPSGRGTAFLEGEGDPGSAAPGKRARLLTRGRLPYRLRWELTCVEATAPSRLVSRIEGDFVGEGIWTISPVDGGTRAALEWNVQV